MINLSDIMQSAHGGQAVENLSARFGLSPDQTQRALDALMPAFQMGLQNKLQSGGIGGLLSHLGHPANRDAFDSPAAAQAPSAATQGGSVLGELFGGGQVLTHIVQQVATESGIPPAVIQAMLPTVASILIGGLMHGAQGGGFGGILSSVLGSVFGQGGGAAPGPQPSGGLGGALGSVLGGLFGGGERDAAPAPATIPAAPATAQQTLDEVSAMITAGAPASPAHDAALGTILKP